MNIDRDTYEAWLLDRLEGRLTAEQERALEAFLAAHPDLRAEAEALGAELPRIPVEGVAFEDAEDLKRTLPPQGLVSDATLDDHLVARLEGDLRPEQEKALARFLYEHPEHARAARLMAVTRLHEGPAAMPDRDRLEKHFPPVGMPDLVRIVDFLIARLEGDLTAEQELALDRFLAAHPELDRVQRQVKAARITAGPVALPDRATLEKHFPPIGAPDRARITDFLIAAHEGDLDAARTEQLRKLVASEAVLQREERLVAAARVRPTADTFPLKERLKKREGRVVPMWSAGRPMVRFAAAASLLLLLGVAWWLLREGPAPGGEVARQEQPAVPKERTTSTSEQAVQGGPVEGTRLGTTEEAGSPVKGGAAQEGPTGPVPAEVTPNEAPTPVIPRERPDALEPLLAQQPAVEHRSPKDVVVPVVPPSADVPELMAAAAPAAEAHTVGELLTGGVRTRVLDRPAEEDRPLDRSDALALADKGLKGITGGTGGVQVQRSAQRDRFKLRLGQGLAFSGSIGR